MSFLISRCLLYVNQIGCFLKVNHINNKNKRNSYTHNIQTTIETFPSQCAYILRYLLILTTTFNNIY
uniref:Uncharacterized protein n=1 Tax=Caudovirales sp. ct2A51 TaxID=2827630 RepID=A0A8S5SZQ7_9CAUD|nr:MAG TPA: hypothetical protein [Caudovirales sp. ct2A51]